MANQKLHRQFLGCFKSIFVNWDDAHYYSIASPHYRIVKF